jgi:predicted PilT family ATPase
LEENLGLEITVEPKSGTMKEELDSYAVSERGNSVVIEVGQKHSGDDIDVYDKDEFLFTATVGQNGDISLTKSSDLASHVIGAAETHSLELRK